jgi:hypothetical protein
MYEVQQGFRPQQYQYGTVSGYYPLQTTDWTTMFSSMMPMFMFILMFALIIPMFKGITAPSK